MFAFRGAVEEHQNGRTTGEAEAAREEMARDLEAKSEKLQAVLKERASLKRRVKRLEAELEGRKPKRSDARRKALVALVKKGKKSDVEAVRAKLREKFAPPTTLKSALDAGVPFRLDSLYSADGSVNHEQVQDAVDAVASRVHRIVRLDARGETGRIGGGRLLIGASLIVGGKTRTGEDGGSRKARNEEEDLLEAYAKSQGAWVDDVDAFRRSLNRIGKGMESEAFEDPDDPGSVIKIAPIPFILGADSSNSTGNFKQEGRGVIGPVQRNLPAPQI